MGRYPADPQDHPGGARAPGRQLIQAAAARTRNLALDLDGTLIDARTRQVGVAARALADVSGETLAAQRFWRAKRAGATTAQALEQLGHARAETVAARWGQCIESDIWLARDRALPSVARALASLRAQGTRVIVVTARTRPAGAALSLQAAGLRELIDELVVVDPRAAVAEKARALRRSEAVAFVGDSESDGAAAATAAVPFAAVATGQRSRRMLQAGGWPVYDSLRAALRSLGELGPAR